jgi:hypothetical protein
MISIKSLQQTAAAAAELDRSATGGVAVRNLIPYSTLRFAK